MEEGLRSSLQALDGQLQETNREMEVHRRALEEKCRELRDKSLELEEKNLELHMLRDQLQGVSRDLANLRAIHEDDQRSASELHAHMLGNRRKQPAVMMRHLDAAKWLHAAKAFASWASSARMAKAAVIASKQLEVANGRSGEIEFSCLLLAPGP
eukprot:426485-Amphidinium_carterae.1